MPLIWRRACRSPRSLARRLRGAQMKRRLVCRETRRKQTPHFYRSRTCGGKWLRTCKMRDGESNSCLTLGGGGNGGGDGGDSRILCERLHSRMRRRERRQLRARAHTSNIDSHAVVAAAVAAAAAIGVRTAICSIQLAASRCASASGRRRIVAATLVDRRRRRSKRRVGALSLRAAAVRRLVA